MVIEVDEWRLLVLCVWGGVSVFTYGLVFIRRLQAWRMHKDTRSARELAVAFALFLVALAASLSIAFLLFGGPLHGARDFWVALALGAFAAAGVVMVSERQAPNHVNKQ